MTENPNAPARVLVLLATGCEEMEATIVIDVLRRAAIEVVAAGIDGADPVVCSRDLRLVPDLGLDQVSGVFDCVVLPGGGDGSRRLAESAVVGELLRQQAAAGRGIAAICAAPAALVAHGIGAGCRQTSHPAVRDTVAAHAEYCEQPVVTDGKLVTSRGPGTAFEFALTLVAQLRDAETAAALRGPMML